MIKKISRKEIEDLIKKTYKIKDVKYYWQVPGEGYIEDLPKFEWIEGEGK